MAKNILVNGSSQIKRKPKIIEKVYEVNADVSYKIMVVAQLLPWEDKFDVDVPFT